MELYLIINSIRDVYLYGSCIKIQNGFYAMAFGMFNVIWSFNEWKVCS